MGRTKKIFEWNEAVKSLDKLLEEQPLLPCLIPLFLIFWVIEKWFFSLSNWVLLVLSVCATIQYGSYQRRNLVEDLNKKWMQLTLQASRTTPIEQCEWLNKLLSEVWFNYINPKLSLRLSSIVERRLKHRRPRLIEKVELQGFSLGSRSPVFGLHGTHWVTSGEQRILRSSFDWDSDDISIMLYAKLASPLMGTARIVINNIHIKGDLLFMPILDGRALLFSFVTTPEVRIGVAFGSGGSNTLPATELPGVSSWLVKVANDTLSKRMVEPRRQCLALPAEDLRKEAVGGVLYVSVLSASNLFMSNLKGNGSTKQTSNSSSENSTSNQGDSVLKTFVEVELEELTRRTDVRAGPNPNWDATFNLILHDNTGILRFLLYECPTGSVKYNYLTSCEIKVRYVLDDSTIFWAIGPENTVIATHAETCGTEVEMTVPLEGDNSAALNVKLELKEWQFADGSHTSASFQHSLSGASNFLTSTGRKICITVVEGKDLVVKEKYGKSDPYVKLLYGKAVQRTKSVPHSSNPTWNQKFEFDEMAGGEYLKIRCFTEETFSDEFIGSARVNLEGLVEGSVRDVRIPLEKVNSGELRFQIEALKANDTGSSKGSQGSSANGWVELVIIEARDIIGADLRGTSDPYVRVHYGNSKRSTKVMYKTVNPTWNQTFEFPDDGSPLTLHLKDHNTVLPTSRIGYCSVEYQMLPPNQTAEKWIPLQGVKKGEIHVQVTRKVPEIEKKPSELESSPSTVRHNISNLMKEMMIKIRSQVDDNNLEGVLKSLSELESLQDTQEELMVQLETEQTLLLDKISELGEEIFNASSPSLKKSRSLKQ